MTSCPDCAAYRRLLEAEARVAEAQLELLEVLLIGAEQQETANASLKHALVSAIALARRANAPPPGIMQ